MEQHMCNRLWPVKNLWSGDPDTEVHKFSFNQESILCLHTCLCSSYNFVHLLTCITPHLQMKPKLLTAARKIHSRSSTSQAWNQIRQPLKANSTTERRQTVRNSKLIKTNFLKDFTAAACYLTRASQLQTNSEKANHLTIMSILQWKHETPEH